MLMATIFAGGAFNISAFCRHSSEAGLGLMCGRMATKASAQVNTAEVLFCRLL